MQSPCCMYCKFEVTFRAGRMENGQTETTVKCHSCCPLRHFIKGCIMICCQLGQYAHLHLGMGSFTLPFSTECMLLGPISLNRFSAYTWIAPAASIPFHKRLLLTNCRHIRKAYFPLIQAYIVLCFSS